MSNPQDNNSIRTSTNSSTVIRKTNKKIKYDVSKDPLALGIYIYI